TVHQLAGGIQVYSSPGSTGSSDLTGGLVFSTASDKLFVAPGSTCGQTKFDPVLRNLYLPCVGGDHVTLVTGHVNPGQRTGLHFDQLAAPASPGGSVGDLFVNAAVDRAGNVYAAWVDTHDHNVYLSGSSDGGHTWTAPLQGGLLLRHRRREWRRPDRLRRHDEPTPRGEPLRRPTGRGPRRLRLDDLPAGPAQPGLGSEGRCASAALRAGARPGTERPVD